MRVNGTSTILHFSLISILPLFVSAINVCKTESPILMCLMCVCVQLYASVKDKMEEMQQQNMSWIEVQFLKIAVDILCQCRQTLMYTYVFAYYLKRNNQSAIFEVSCTNISPQLLFPTFTFHYYYFNRDLCFKNVLTLQAIALFNCYASRHLCFKLVCTINLKFFSDKFLTIFCINSAI